MGRHGDAGQRLEDGGHRSRRYRDRALVKRTAGLWAAHLVRGPRETLLARGAAGVAGAAESAGGGYSQRDARGTAPPLWGGTSLSPSPPPRLCPNPDLPNGTK